jgi:hypothetical protein
VDEGVALKQLAATLIPWIEEYASQSDVILSGVPCSLLLPINGVTYRFETRVVGDAG